MNDEFFKFLREIQRKERSNNSLSKVGADFHKKTYDYLDEVKEIAESDPFSAEHDLLKNIQRIATEICEIREHKIADSAIINIHRSYHLFKGKPKFDLLDTTPLNLTEEEEKLYFSFIDVLKNHRRSISLEELTSLDYDEKNSNFSTNEDNNLNGDEVLNRLNNIKKAKIVENESFGNINKEINNSNQPNDTIESEIGEKELKSSKEISNKTAKQSSNTSSQAISSNISNQSQSPENNLNGSSNKTSHKISNENSQNEEKNTEKDKINENKIRKNEINNNSIEKQNEGSNSPLKVSNTQNTKNSKISEDFIGNEDDQFINLDELDVHHDVDKSPSNKIFNVPILVFSKINSIVGVDEKIYGPFYPQDIAIIPNINAEILIKNRKGRLVKY